MLFTSYGFLFAFLPIVLLLYWCSPSLRFRKYVSVLSSYVFYGVWSPKFAALMLLTTSVDFFTAREMDEARHLAGRRVWLAASLIVNLGVLGFFKYYDFFAGTLDAVLPHPVLPLFHVVLPIGISFYTFESMSYTIDVYRHKTPALRRFIDYAHFVTMFPRLVAGPIVRYCDLQSQLDNLPRQLSWSSRARAVHFFTCGLVKKMLIADVLAKTLVDPLWANPGAVQFFSGWTGAVAYAMQLYFDFSGYSDMAVGLGLLLGLELPRNFELPYTARSITDFWRRWHISLSSWLKDYLYIPLGGNRKGALRTYVNVFVTMLLGGLWHGANWTFVMWGAYHGLAQVLERWYASRTRKQDVATSRTDSVALTFLAVVVGWVLFRAPSIDLALQVYRAMLGLNGLDLTWLTSRLPDIAFLGAATILSFTVDTYDLELSGRQVRWALVYTLALVVCVLRLASPSPFLYFQF